MKLTDLNVLILDCQTTGSSPDGDRIIEFGWAPFRISVPVSPRELDPKSHLIRSPESTDVPRRVRELTGIDQGMLEEGDPLERVEETFLDAAGRTNRLLAHYARFERRFLKAETALRHPDRFHDQQFLCTHEIATRLFPDLPRRSLRAMAGYFGHSIPEQKRVTPHVRGTAVIWTNLVRVLDETEDVRTIDELEEWLERTSGKRTGEGYSYPISRERRLSLPEKPGTYHMIDREERILYIGKATSLKDRVNTYFQAASQLSGRKLELVSRVRDVDCRPAPTALEASLRENDEIKEHNPPYNKSLTKRNRTVLYCDDTFTEFSPERTEHHPIGPFSRRRRVAALGALFRILRNEPVSEHLQHLPRLSSLMSETAFEEGVECLRSRHGLTDIHTEDVQQTLLLSLGQTLWIKKQKEKEEKSEDSEQDAGKTGDPLQPGGERTEERTHMTPNEIADRLESILRRGVRDLRRARWFEETSTSVLSWKPGVFENGRWRTIVLERGRIRERTSTPSRPDISPPDRIAAPSVPSNVTIHDRLRVFTTVLKQLVEKQRSPVLRTATGTTFDQSSLETVLWWM